MTSLQQPDLRPNPWGKYLLHETYLYEWSYQKPGDRRPRRYKLNIPAGFLWNGTSLPREMWDGRILPDGPNRAATLIHDFFYRQGGRIDKPHLAHYTENGEEIIVPLSTKWNRKQADDLLYMIMLEAGVPHTKAEKVWEIVRVYGGEAWSKREKEFPWPS